MVRALTEAEKAAALGDVPVGALVVADGEILGVGHNRREVENDPTAHAEIVALRHAAKKRRSWRLDDTTLVVTLEPCPMCAGALVNARVARLVYGCDDPKAGAARSLFSVCNDSRLNHRLEISAGLLADRSAELLRRFFAARR